MQYRSVRPPGWPPSRLVLQVSIPQIGPLPYLVTDRIQSRITCDIQESMALRDNTPHTRHRTPPRPGRHLAVIFISTSARHAAGARPLRAAQRTSQAPAARLAGRGSGQARPQAADLYGPGLAMRIPKGPPGLAWPFGSRLHIAWLNTVCGCRPGGPESRHIMIAAHVRSGYCQFFRNSH